MTHIHVYDPGDGPQLPELPPLPVSVLLTGLTEMLGQATDLPQPDYITVNGEDQHADLQFPQGETACGPSPAGCCGSAAW